MAQRGYREGRGVTQLYLALVHHPIMDRAGEVVTTAVTNLDVHDIARSCRTFDVGAYFLVTPLTSQRQIVQRILEHWTKGSGATKLPNRREALELCRPVHSLEEAIGAISDACGQAPEVWVTSARTGEREPLGWADARARLSAEGGPVLLVFGTGHGLAAEVLHDASATLPPVRPKGYNHLSVRAAVAIILDRLRGDG